MQTPAAPIALVGLLVAVPLVGQTASYVATRDACNGAPVVRCLQQNESPMTFSFTSQPYDYAFAVTNTSGAPVQVLGFELFTRSVTNAVEFAPSSFYRDVSGAGALVHTRPATVAEASGTIRVAGFGSWWSTSIYPAPIVQPGEAFWIGFDPQARIAPPLNASGLPGAAPSYYRRPNVNNNAWTVLTAVGEPAFRLRCTSPAAVPWLQALDLPRPGQQLRLSLQSPATPGTVTFLFWSLDSLQFLGLPTPVDLSIFGASDCFAYTASDVPVVFVLDAQGNGVFSTVLPANNALLGLAFFNQAAVAAPLTPLGFVTSNLGSGVVGN